MFDAELLGLPSVGSKRPREEAECAVATDVAVVEQMASAIPTEAPPTRPQIPPTPTSTLSLPLFVLPPGFAFDGSSSGAPPSAPAVTVATGHDARREKIDEHRSKTFPMAGLMREEGGVFAFLDKQRARTIPDNYHNLEHQ